MGRTIPTGSGKLVGAIAVGWIAATLLGSGIKTSEAQFGPADAAGIIAKLEEIKAVLIVKQNQDSVRNVELAEIKLIQGQILTAIGPIETNALTGGPSTIDGLRLSQEVVPSFQDIMGEKDLELPELGNFSDFTSKAEDMFGTVVSYKKLFEKAKAGKIKVTLNASSLDLLNRRRAKVYRDATNRSFAHSMNLMANASKAENTKNLLEVRRSTAPTVQQKLAANGALTSELLSRMNHLIIAMAHSNYSRSTSDLNRLTHVPSDLREAPVSASEGSGIQSGLERLGR